MVMSCDVGIAFGSARQECGCLEKGIRDEEGIIMKQNEQGKKGLSRRAFLGLGGTALAGAAVVGMAGCAP